VFTEYNSRFAQELAAAQEMFTNDLDAMAQEIDAFKNYGDLEKAETVCIKHLT